MLSLTLLSERHLPSAPPAVDTGLKGEKMSAASSHTAEAPHFREGAGKSHWDSRAWAVWDTGWLCESKRFDVLELWDGGGRRGSGRVDEKIGDKRRMRGGVD